MTRPKSTKKAHKPKPKVSGPLAEGKDPRTTQGPQDWRLAFATKRPIGPPTKYNPTLHPKSYLELSSLGYMKTQICAQWGIHRDTLNEWGKDKTKPELSDAIKAGDELRTAWWVNFATAGTTGRLKGFQQTMAIYLMNNICAKDFRARVEHTHSLDIEDMDFGD